MHQKWVKNQTKLNVKVYTFKHIHSIGKLYCGWEAGLVDLLYYKTRVQMMDR